MSEFLHYMPKGKKRPQALGVLFLGLGAFLLVCLMSHSRLDPPNSSRSMAESLNWGGVDRRVRVVWGLCRHGTARVRLAHSLVALGLE